MSKKFFLGCCVLCLSLAMTGCGGSTADNAAEEEAAPEAAATATGEQKIFTLEELAAYNGEDGQPAYIAIDGTVYDMSQVAPWAGGSHKGFQAGHDYSKEIVEESPHGKAVLKKLTPVGTLAE